MKARRKVQDSKNSVSNEETYKGNGSETSASNIVPFDKSIPTERVSELRYVQICKCRDPLSKFAFPRRRDP